MLIMNMVLETDDLDPTLQTRANFVLTLKFAPIFLKFGTHDKWNIQIMNINSCIFCSNDAFDDILYCRGGFYTLPTAAVSAPVIIG